MHPVRTLVLVASEKTARLLVNAGVGKGLQPLREVAAADFPDVGVPASDRPGRSTAAAGAVARHGFDPHETERDRRRGRFAAHLAEALADEWARGGYDRIVIAAAPRLLGELRADLPEALRPHVVAELDKDLAKVPLAELAPHFHGVAVF